MKGDFKIPASFNKDKEFWLKEYVRMGFLTAVPNKSGYFTLSKKFRKENPKLMNDMLQNWDADDVEGNDTRDDVLCQLQSIPICNSLICNSLYL